MERKLQSQEELANLQPQDKLQGFDVRPGFYEMYGATAFPNGVNFTIISFKATACTLLLFHRKERQPYACLPFPPHYRVGNVYSMFVFGLKIDEFEYAYSIDGPYEPEKGLIFKKNKYLLDPYAKAVTGQSGWGLRLGKEDFYKARVVHNDFRWDQPSQTFPALRDCVIYELHVRGFTRHKSAGVQNPGTFDGIREKIPYLKELGINAVELMPIFEFDETRNMRQVDGRQLLDYWGYNPVCFFAPNTSYASEVEYNREGKELKELIKALHAAGIQVFLDVVFNHTAEGNEKGPYFSFKGFDNQIYYMLTPEGYYYNFSGCGNTLNCNHPVVREMILDCLRYWVTRYHVDGFRFDLASILGRSEDGAPYEPPAPAGKPGLRPHPAAGGSDRGGLGRRRPLPGGQLPLLEPLGGVERQVSGRHPQLSKGGCGICPGCRPAHHRLAGFVFPAEAGRGCVCEFHYLPRRLYPLRPVRLQPKAQRGQRLEQYGRGG